MCFPIYRSECSGKGAAPLHIEIVKQSDDMKGFVVLLRCWVVKRTFS